MNSYEILGIKPGATEEQVKQAYRELAQKYSSEEYSASPMKEQAEQEMEKINTAFDEVMATLREGKTEIFSENPTSEKTSTGEKWTQIRSFINGGKWTQIRDLINAGQIEQAMDQLNAIPEGASQAEWNFLMGSAFYYKGWLNEALRYFSTACRLSPGNREYEAALRHLQSGQTGRIPNNPYGNYGGIGGHTMSCSCCDICTTLICMDTCCSCCGGF